LATQDHTDPPNLNPCVCLLLLQMRSKRNFCIDIVLVCILLGIGAYIFAMVTKKKS
jgi:multisubunit Na+/H+ antiporter MnhF subunit